jgi:hypothetical protein
MLLQIRLNKFHRFHHLDRELNLIKFLTDSLQISTHFSLSHLLESQPPAGIIPKTFSSSSLFSAKKSSAKYFSRLPM